MQLFVSEFICSGACPETKDYESLRGEGLAMLLALLADLAAVPQCHLVTTWDARLPLPELGAVDWRRVTQGPQQETELFCQLAGESDLTLVVAPESNGILSDRCRLVDASQGTLAGCSSIAVETCSDKLAVSEILEQHGVPTPITTSLSADVDPIGEFPFVIKPRHGAGSRHTRLIRNQREWDACRHAVRRSVLPEMLQQEFQSGIPRSVVVLVDADDESFQMWPFCHQQFSQDGRFEFLGGRIDSASFPSAQLEDNLKIICRCVSGLRGYVGIDLVCPSDGSPPSIIDLNPRLTTAFLGYRRLAMDNLGSWLIGSNHGKRVRWRSEPVDFDCGDVASVMSTSTLYSSSMIHCEKETPKSSAASCEVEHPRDVR
ncbi:MAG: ATP-grasp domain-containing protein [Planctomycetaceae bacterium]